MNPSKFTSHAPTRIDLAGGTLDLWPIYCLIQPAKTINIAVDLPASAQFQVESSQPTEFVIHCQQSSTSIKEPHFKIETLAKPLQFPVWILSHFWKPAGKVTLTLSAKVPVGSGLGGSSALCIAILSGLNQLYGLNYDKEKLLQIAKDIEAGFLRIPTGLQDYLAALHGGVNSFHFNIGGVERFAFSEQVLEELNKRIVIIFSGESHQSGLSNWSIFQKFIDGNVKVIEGMREISRVSDRLFHVLQEKLVSWNEVGQLLNQEWKVRKEIFEVNTPQLDQILNFFQSEKVLGAKVCGAAQGGSLIALVEPDQKKNFQDKCKAKGYQVLETILESRGTYFN